MASHLRLFCLPMSHKKDAMLIWVKGKYKYKPLQKKLGIRKATINNFIQVCFRQQKSRWKHCNDICYYDLIHFDLTMYVLSNKYLYSVEMY